MAVSVIHEDFNHVRMSATCNGEVRLAGLELVTLKHSSIAEPLSHRQVLSVHNGAAQTAGVLLQIAAGHLSSAELSAVVLGSSVCKVFGMSLMAGLASALDTLCGQVQPPGHMSRTAMHLPSQLAGENACAHALLCTLLLAAGSRQA